MSLPVPSMGGGLSRPVKDLVEAAHVGLATGVEVEKVAKAVRDAGSAAERADLHVQKWREGIAKLMLEMQLSEELDPARTRMVKTEGWKLLKEAAQESAAIMAELRSYWNPEDKVEIRD